MATVKKRIALFLTLCLGARFLFAYIAKKAKPNQLYFLGFIGLVMGMGFLYNYIIPRKIGAFKQHAWWNYMRPIHAFLFISFGIIAIQKNSNAYKILVVDTILGLIAFTNHHFLK